MSDIMIPVEFGRLMTHILQEKEMYNTAFSVKYYELPTNVETINLFGHEIESSVGPSAGPHTQLAQNIVASYVSGARFIELKTIQHLYGEELGIPRPCINSVDEGYNVEWSSEFSPKKALEEYVKAWVALKVIAKEFSLGSPDGFVFNMSVGYNLAGIQSESVDAFIEGCKDASTTDMFATCKQWLLDHLHLFKHIDAAFVESMDSHMVESISLSTMHGCPANEIEDICRYLLEAKHLHVYLKCNPTLLGYETCRSLLDAAGYDYVQFSPSNFEADIDLGRAVPMIKELQAFAIQQGVTFGVKLTNTFPVNILEKELPGEQMYMSGKALLPLTIGVAKVLSEALDGKIAISYSGGVDAGNAKDLLEIGIYPITVCTILLQGMGYNQFGPIVKKCSEVPTASIPKQIDIPKLNALVERLGTDEKYKKSAVKVKQRNTQPAFPSTRSDDYTCKVVCGNCVRVCPNRANETILLEDGKNKLIIHIDDHCNECGNCACACIELCQPYKDRVTFFSTKELMEQSTNDGFCKNETSWTYRFEGHSGSANISDLPSSLQKIVVAFSEQHPYYLS